MNKQQYLAYHKACREKMADITTRKNADYTGNSVDPFANFTACAKIEACTVEQGFVVRMTDKLQRIVTLAVHGNEAKVLDEKIEDTLLDLANYCLLFAGYLKSKKSVGE